MALICKVDLVPETAGMGARHLNGENELNY